MLSCFFITSLFFVTINSQDKDLLFFNSNSTILSKCVEDYLLNMYRQHLPVMMVQEISCLTAKRFSGKIMIRSALNKRLHAFIYDVRHQKITNTVSTDQLSNWFRKSLSFALEDCADDSVTNLLPESEQLKSGNYFKDSQWVLLNLDRKRLAECIKNHLLNSDPNWGKNEFVKNFADLAAKRFSRKVIAKKILTKEFLIFFYQLRHQKISHQLNRNQLTHKLSHELRKALEKCVLDLDESSSISLKEPYEISILLNYTIVSWSDSLYTMIQTRDGRALLRRYADEAQTALVRALNTILDFDVFRSLLRVFWMCRIRKFFDENNVQNLYFTYHYTTYEQRVSC